MSSATSDPAGKTIPPRPILGPVVIAGLIEARVEFVDSTTPAGEGLRVVGGHRRTPAGGAGWCLSPLCGSINFTLTSPIDLGRAGVEMTTLEPESAAAKTAAVLLEPTRRWAPRGQTLPAAAPLASHGANRLGH